MPSQVIVIFAAGLFALGGIWVLISGFDDDDNDGDGMAYSTLDSYQFSILEGSWDLIASCEIFLCVTDSYHTKKNIFARESPP